jgi:hypothetical protein
VERQRTARGCVLWSRRKSRPLQRPEGLKWALALPGNLNCLNERGPGEDVGVRGVRSQLYEYIP